MKKETEIWKNIKNYEDLYQISNYGKIKSLSKILINCYNEKRLTKEKILSHKFSRGYYFIYLYKNKNKERFYIHQLVAIYFIDNPNNLIEVNHLDENKSNNYYENLKWSTHKENIQHSIKTKTINHIHCSNSINVYDKNNKFIKSFDSNKEAADWRKVGKTSMHAYVNKRRKDPKGYIWKNK